MMKDLSVLILIYHAMIIFILNGREYWAFRDKGIGSFNELVIDSTFYVCTIMQDIRLVVACVQQE